MDRARPRLTASLVVLFALLPLAIGCTTGGSPVAGSTGSPTTTVTRASPTPSGYPLAKGRRVQLTKGQTGTVKLAVGDVLVLPRPSKGTRPSGDVLVLAEVTETQFIFQAVSAGQSTLSTDDPPPPPPCQTTPCPPGRAAPPVVTVDVTG